MTAVNAGLGAILHHRGHEMILAGTPDNSGLRVTTLRNKVENAANGQSARRTVTGPGAELSQYARGVPGWRPWRSDRFEDLVVVAQQRDKSDSLAARLTQGGCGRRSLLVATRHRAR